MERKSSEETLSRLKLYTIEKIFVIKRKNHLPKFLYRIKGPFI